MSCYLLVMDLHDRRRRILSNPSDHALHVHIGYFVVWYSKAELGLTYLLALVCRISDFEAFELLVRGMDAGNKVRRLRDICKKRRLIIPEAFAGRLKYFQRTIVKTRNRVAHSSPSL